MGLQHCVQTPSAAITFSALTPSLYYASLLSSIRYKCTHKAKVNVIAHNKQNQTGSVLLTVTVGHRCGIDIDFKLYYNEWCRFVHGLGLAP